MTLDLGARIDGLIDVISERRPVSVALDKALRAVHRHRFVPPAGVALTGGGPRLIDRHADPDTWWATVYGPDAIVTQLDAGATDIREVDGRYTSSNSAPGTVVDLLTLLDPEPGDRVLEIGTGTGWTAALLSHLVGEHGIVTSIEVDHAVAEQAGKTLAAAGVHPRLVVGDGADGWAEGAPYDRVHVTCAVHTVPYAWVEQTRPGGVILAPFSPGFDVDFSVRLVVMPGGVAVGRFPGCTSYMLMRSQDGSPVADDDGSGRRSTTQVDPHTIAYAPAGAGLAMSALTGLHLREVDEGDRFVLYVVDPADPAHWAAAVHDSDGDHLAYQLGDRSLWDEITDAYAQWVSWGEPDRERFGMTITQEGQRIWLDTPERTLGHAGA
ncbi:methyltransferase domain-containing protein [Nonomuraea sp. NPDC050153]|uniref:methyltransferase domain-containing protein n=1 Tax=Nonomuraea sp. NPDC050153 TaxID=3364359 RepID=UPI0037B4E205